MKREVPPKEEETQKIQRSLLNSTKQAKNIVELDTIMRSKGWAGFMKFQYQEGMDIESHIKKQLSSDNMLKKRFFLFSVGSLNISKDSSGKTIYKNIIYQGIKNLQMLSKSSFYFVSKEKGFALFFKDYVETNAQLFHDFLHIMIKKYSTKKQKIVRFELSESLDHLLWLQAPLKYKYEYKYEKKVPQKEEVIKMEVSSDDEEVD